MYFNFEDYRPDTPTLPRSLTRLEVVLLTVVVYLCVVILMLIWPNLPWVRAAEARRQQVLEEIRKQELEQRREAARFVFMQPRVDIKSLKPPPPRSELSDIDRRARTVERAPNPTNSMPFARGNTSERIEAAPPVASRAAPSAQPEPSPDSADPMRQGLTLPDARTAAEPRSAEKAMRDPSAGVIANALRNAQKYAQQSGMVNLQGGADQEVAPSIQFDSKGVDFGPWLRRFIAQIKRNWFIPYAAMSMHGHVVVTFYVGKDGRITELKVLKPSGIDAFNNSAYGALVASNPTQPLPTEYPDDRAFFTVTFFFNEDPGTR
jgi:TonB family protein